MLGKHKNKFKKLKKLCFLDQNQTYQNQHAISLRQFSDYTMTVTSENEAPNQSLHHTTLRSSTNISSVTWKCLARADVYKYFHLRDKITAMVQGQHLVTATHHY